MLKAAIDIGTNSVRVLVADVTAGRLQLIAKDLQTTRLGEGVHASRVLNAAAMERTIVAVQQFAEQAQRLGAHQILAAATSAVRDAANGREFTRRCQEQTGVAVTILDGQSEARLSFAGAVADWPDGTDCFVVDIGGGSTEVIMGTGRSLIGVNSFNIGAVRLSELFTADADGRVSCLPQVRKYIDEQLAMLTRRQRPDLLIGVGGTITSLAAVDQELFQYSREKVHGYHLQAVTIDDWLTRLAAMSLTERRQLAGLQPERADIIVYGAAILASLVDFLGADAVQVSEQDILEGIILHM